MEQRFEKQIRAWKDVIDQGKLNVSRRVMFQILTRVAATAPEAITRVEIARRRDLGDDFGRLSEGAVSRAVKFFTGEGVLEQSPSKTGSDSSFGRMINLSRDRYRAVGMHIHARHGLVTGVTGVVTGLAGNHLASDYESLAGARSGQDVEVKELVEACRVLLARLLQRSPATADGQKPVVVGVGVDLGGHIFAGTVISSTNENWESVDLASQLEEELKLPVVLENDVNALAIWETHRRRFSEQDIAVIAIFDEGIGSALVIGGRTYRGGRGMAGELGHLTVRRTHTEDRSAAGEYERPALAPGADESAPSFDDRCPMPCNKHDHVDCRATPLRIRGELGVASFDAAALSSAVDPVTAGPTPAGLVFAEAGSTLGQAAAALVDLLSPTRLLVLAPAALTTPPPVSAGAAYIEAMEAALGDAFSTGFDDACAGESHVSVRSITDVSDVRELFGPAPGDGSDADLGLVMSRAAASCVFDALLARIAGKLRPRRPGDYQIPVFADIDDDQG